VTGTWHVEVDRMRCMGTGACAYALPGLFTVGDDGKAMVVGTVNDAENCGLAKPPASGVASARLPGLATVVSFA